MVYYLALYWNTLVALVLDMSPWLLLGFGIAGILHVFFPEGKINKFLGDSSTKHVFRAAIFGIPLPLCSCGVIPTGISIYRSGASKGASISFLISTPQTGVDSVMVTYSLLGLPFAILRPIIALVTGVLGGIIANLAEKKHYPNDDSEKKTQEQKADSNAKKMADSRPISVVSKAYKAVHYAMVDFFGDVAPSLLLGLLAAALIAILVPNDFFAAHIKSDLLGMVVILVASIPLYVCATSSVPIAAVLIAKGLSPGAAIVFLMAGPATNAATITMIGSVMGRRTLLIYLGTIVTGALFFGLVTDHFLPREWFVSTVAAHAHDHELLPGWVWVQIGSSLVFVTALGYAIFRRFVPKQHLAGEGKQTIEEAAERKQIVLKIKGMTCGHCKRTVEEAVRGLAGVEDVEADLGRATLTICGNPDITYLYQTLETLGFEAELA